MLFRPAEATRARAGANTQPRCTQHFIGEEIKRDKSQVSKAVGRLIECGLVQRLDDGTLAPNT